MSRVRIIKQHTPGAYSQSTTTLRVPVGQLPRLEAGTGVGTEILISLDASPLGTLPG